MSTILFISTIALNVAGFAFAGIYLWMNIFKEFSDISDRNESILKITKISMILSLVFAFLTSLLSKADNIEHAISQSTTLYSIIAISWLIILAGCGIIMLISVVSKKYFKASNSSNIRRIFKIALPAAIIAMVLTWLFS